MPNTYVPESLDDYLRKNPGVSVTAPQRRQFGWGDRFGAAVDSAQAGLYGVAESFGIAGAGTARRENQHEADAARQRAIEDTRSPDSYKEVNGVGSGAKYVGGLLVDSSPLLGGGLIAALGAGGAWLYYRRQTLHPTLRMGREDMQGVATVNQRPNQASKPTYLKKSTGLLVFSMGALVGVWQIVGLFNGLAVVIGSSWHVKSSGDTFAFFAAKLIALGVAVLAVRWGRRALRSPSIES